MLCGQESAIDIPKAELPKKAVCAVCVANGKPEEDEKPAAGVKYKGVSYYFCDAKEVADFKKDPEPFLPPVLPRPAPAWTFTDLDGKAVSLTDQKGKVVLLDFWATWCAPCIKAMPELDKLTSARKDQGLVTFGVSIDEDPKKVPPFLKKKPVGYPIVLDDAKSPTWADYKVRVVPALFLIDQKGQIVAQWRGAADMKAVAKEVDKLLAEK